MHVISAAFVSFSNVCIAQV